MATYDLKYPGAAIDAILDTAYDLQNAGYIFRGLASEYSNTPTERSWVLAGEGETGHGFTSPVPKGYIGVCVFNGTSWTGKLLKCVSIDSTPTNGSTNALSSGGAYTSISQLAATVNEALDNLTFTDATPSAFLGEYITEKVSTTDGGIERIMTYFTILAATAEKAGLLSAADKQKLDAMLGNLRSLKIDDTTAYADLGTNIVESIKATIGGTEETISTFQILAATASKAGLLSAADKAKLDSLWSSGYQFAGIATPSTTPVSTTSNIFYIATEAGTYFNAVTVTQGINILSWNGTSWSAVQVIGIDDEPTAGSSNLVTSGGIKSAIDSINGVMLEDNYTNSGSNNFSFDIGQVNGVEPIYIKIETDVTEISKVRLFYYNASEEQLETYQDIDLNVDTKLNVPEGAITGTLYRANVDGNTNGDYKVVKRTSSTDEKINAVKREILQGGSICDKFFLGDSTFDNILTGILGVYTLRDFSDDSVEYWLKTCGYRNNNPSQCFLVVYDGNDTLIEQTGFSVSVTDVLKVVDCAGFRFVIDAKQLPSNSSSAFIGYNLHLNKNVPGYIKGVNDIVSEVNSKANKDKLYYKSVNLFDGEIIPDTWIMSTSGVPSERAGWFTTKNLIPVELGKEYHFSFFNGTIRRNSNSYFCEFDENGDAITTEENLRNQKYVVEDSTVKYIMVSFSIPTGMTAESIKAMVFEWNARAMWMSPDQTSEFYSYQTEYEYYGYEEILPLNYSHKGKKMVCFGDSITDFGFYPEYAAYCLGISVFNAGFGGARMTNTAIDGTAPLSMYELINAVVSGDFSTQIAAAQAAASEHPNWSGKVEGLSNIDFGDIDIVTIAYGVNDFSASVPIGSDTDMVPTTIKGAMNLIIQAIKTNYPKAQVVFIPPMYRRYGDADSDSYTNGNGNRLPDVVEGEEAVARLNHCEYLELYYTLGVNKYNWATYLIDGTHPTNYGYVEIGRRLFGYLFSH